MILILSINNSNNSNKNKHKNKHKNETNEYNRIDTINRIQQKLKKK